MKDGQTLEGLVAESTGMDLESIARLCNDRREEHRQALNVRVSEAASGTETKAMQSLRSPEFNPGQWVWELRDKEGRTPKMVSKWVGPKTIVQRASPISWWVRNVSGNDKVRKIHALHLKPFIRRGSMGDEGLEIDENWGCGREKEVNDNAVVGGEVGAEI
jgi:hypothetical protein